MQQTFILGSAFAVSSSGFQVFEFFQAGSQNQQVGFGACFVFWTIFYQHRLREQNGKSFCQNFDGSLMNAKTLSALPKVEIQFIEPMYARLVNELPKGKEWLYEVKFESTPLPGRPLAGRCQEAQTFL